MGVGCQPIPGVVGQSYQLSAADVGSTLRVQETAANAYGAGPPAMSAASGTVTPARAHQASIAGSEKPFVGVPQRYQASVVDADGSPTGYKWLADGKAVGTKPALRYTFATKGRHVLTLQVQDTAGNTMSATLTVTAVLRRLAIRTAWTDSYSARSSVFNSLIAHAVPVHARIELTCVGGGCPWRHLTVVVKPAKCHGKACKHRPAARDVDLGRPFRTRQLAVGTRLTIAYRLPQFVGQLDTFTIGPKGPVRQVACLAPGATRPGRGC